MANNLPDNLKTDWVDNETVMPIDVNKWSSAINKIKDAIPVYSANGNFYTATYENNVYSLSPITMNSQTNVPPSTYIDGMKVIFKCPSNNLANCSVNVNSLGNKAIKNFDGSNIGAGVFIIGNYIELIYDSSQSYFKLSTPIRSLTADKLTNGAKINGVSFKGDSDIITGLGLHNVTVTYNQTNLAYKVIDDEVIVKRCLNNNTVGDNFDNEAYWEKVELGGSRNICELVVSAIPLTDAGLHLLDGELLEGKGIYSDFVNRMASRTEYNSNVFTITGNPNITENGIGSGFNASNYLSMPFDSSLTNFRFEFNFTTSDTVIENYILGGDAISEKRILAFVNVYGVSASIYKADGTNLTLSSNLHGGISANTKYLGYVEYDGTKYTIGIKTEQESNWTTNEVTSSFVSDLNDIYIKPFGGGDNNFSVDLKGYSASTNGTTIFSGIITPSYFCTESEWQQSITDYGVCGKFVYDPVANTVRLPKITGKIEGTTDLTALGDLMPLLVKLPNITGTIKASNIWEGTASASGCVTVKNNGDHNACGDGGSRGNTYTWTINASRSSSVYSGNGTDTTIHEQAINVLFYIVVATSTKTQIQVDIDNIATDLNNALNQYKYDGQWVYTQLSIATSVTAPTTTDLIYSLSTYLPNDGYNYEVLFSASCSTGNTSGNVAHVILETDLQPNEFLVALARTRTSSTMASAGSCIIAVGIDREVIIKPHTSNTGLISLTALGYRRIGTNS